MTIAELINKLKEYPMDMEVVGYYDGDGADLRIAVVPVPENNNVMLELW